MREREKVNGFGLGNWKDGAAFVNQAKLQKEQVFSQG